jgi:hypothetical protein
MERTGFERRSFPRPPLWLNLLLVIIAMATFAYAKHHRNVIREKSVVLFHPSENSPAELNRMRDELARMDLTKDQLAKELDGRLKYMQSLQGEDFYISIDIDKKKMQFRLGKTVVREADVQIGEAKSITAANGKKWTFYPLKGGFNVVDKDDSYDSPVPEWVFALRNEPIPERRPTLHNWLGHYIIFLPNNYVIHSPPPANSPLQGPKPGSFLVPEDDLAAIWARITNQTRVYIF